MEPEVEGMGRVKSGDAVDMVVVVQWERVIACCFLGECVRV